MIPEEIQRAFDACSIPVVEGGWYPSMPPVDTAYAELDDAERIEFDDYKELYVSYHTVTLRLYSLDANKTRLSLRDALFAELVPVTNIEVTGQSIETKQYETVFSIAGEYKEKWRKNQ